jgi:predicted nuclease of predicted toxin-antitoxin system
MKLLFDQSLSPRLVDLLADVYPDSNHVSTMGLDRAADEEVFARAGEQGYTVVSKDADFAEMSQAKGAPPKILRLRLGNCTTAQIEQALRFHQQTIQRLGTDPETEVLELW